MKNNLIKDAEGKRLARVITYRALSVLTEFIIVYAITRNIYQAMTISPLCLIIHSSLHWLVDKLIR